MLLALGHVGDHHSQTDDLVAEANGVDALEPVVAVAEVFRGQAAERHVEDWDPRGEDRPEERLELYPKCRHYFRDSFADVGPRIDFLTSPPQPSTPTAFSVHPHERLGKC